MLKSLVTEWLGCSGRVSAGDTSRVDIGWDSLCRGVWPRSRLLLIICICGAGWKPAAGWQQVLSRFGGGGPRYAANPGLTPIFGPFCRKLAVGPRFAPRDTPCPGLVPPKRLSTRRLETPRRVGTPPVAPVAGVPSGPRTR